MIVNGTQHRVESSSVANSSIGIADQGQDITVREVRATANLAGIIVGAVAEGSGGKNLIERNVTTLNWVGIVVGGCDDEEEHCTGAALGNIIRENLATANSDGIWMLNGAKDNLVQGNEPRADGLG